MDAIIAYLRKLFGRELTIAKITSPITKIVDQLDTHSSQKAHQGAKLAANAEKLIQNANAARTDAEEAAALSVTYSRFLGKTAA